LGKGKKVKKGYIEWLDGDESKDLLEGLARKTEVLALLFFARMVKGGLLEFDEAIGKYRMTTKGKEAMEEWEKQYAGIGEEELQSMFLKRILTPQIWSPDEGRNKRNESRG